MNTLKDFAFLNQKRNCCSICLTPFNVGDQVFYGYDISNSPVVAGTCCTRDRLNFITQELHRTIFEIRPFAIPVPQTTIWRYMDYTKFSAMLFDQSLYFSRNDLLGDAFEGALSNYKNEKAWALQMIHRMKENDSNILQKLDLEGSFNSDEFTDAQIEQLLRALKDLSLRHRKTGYVNCWHVNTEESVAMWNLYVNNNQEGVAIKSSVGHVLDSFISQNSVQNGLVNYVDFSNHISDQNERFWNKRVSYSHENEFRLLFQIPTEIKSAMELEIAGINLNVRLNKLIDLVYVSPSAPAWFRSLVERTIKNHGLILKVVQSELDQSPLF